MATLDKVIQLKNEGLPDYEITTQLRNEGISPQEINDALNQAQVKNAVTADSNQKQQQPIQQNQNQQYPGQEMQQYPEQNMQQYQYPGQEMQQYPEPQANKIMQESIINPPYQQQTQQPMQQNPQIQEMQQEILTPQYQEPYYSESPQAYYDQNYYPPQAGSDSETITEIAEQVVSEKFKEFNKRTGDLTIFKQDTKEKLENVTERVKKIEDSIEKLQLAIIQKIGEFGESTIHIQKDLENLHNTTSKLMNPLIDNYNILKKIAGENPPQKKSEKNSNKK